MQGIPVEGLVALVGLGLIGVMLLLSKIFTKLWMYLLLLSPSWATTLYSLAVVTNEQGILSAIQNHSLELLFILSPIDKYLITSESLQIYGVVLLGIWAWVILITCKSLLGAWMLPVAPLIWWILGRGLGNTMQLLTPHLPDWLLTYSGLPLILLTCVLIGIALFIYKIRIRKS